MSPAALVSRTNPTSVCMFQSFLLEKPAIIAEAILLQAPPAACCPLSKHPPSSPCCIEAEGMEGPLLHLSLSNEIFGLMSRLTKKLLRSPSGGLAREGRSRGDALALCFGAGKLVASGS